MFILISASEDLADVLVITLAKLHVWDDDPFKVFGLDDLRSLTVVKDALFVFSLSY